MRFSLKLSMAIGGLVLVCGLVFGGYLIKCSLDRMKAVTQLANISVCILREIQRQGGTTCDLEDLKARVPTTDGEGLIRRNEEGQLIDLWGNPVKLTIENPKGQVRVKVSSSGPDGVWGTTDDISYSQTVELASNAGHEKLAPSVNHGKAGQE